MSSVNLPHAIEGKVVYASPVSSFFYKDGNKGFVQRFLISDIITQDQPIKFKVVVWNDLVGENLLKLDHYFKISNFNIKKDQFSNIPEDQSCYEIHLKKTSKVEEIPFIAHFLNHGTL